MDEVEEFVGEFVARMLEGRATPRDLDGAQNTRDFDIELPSRMIALEITGVHDEELSGCSKPWRRDNSSVQASRVIGIFPLPDPIHPRPMSATSGVFMRSAPSR